MTLPKITFGIVNCNRLYYMKSCLESLLECTESYENKEIIIVDNASAEEGTSEYLAEKEAQGITVVRNLERDPKNEFAKGLNKIFELSTGDYICPLQGDTQFVVKGPWLENYVNFFNKFNNSIGCIGLDAQRKVRIINHAPFGVFNEDHMGDEFRFYIDPKRAPICGAADVFYSRRVLSRIYPWHVDNGSHEGGNDSETEMLSKIQNVFSREEIDNMYFISPQIPVSVGIFTDPRGTNARVRGNYRYGEYWPPKEGFKYYKIHDMKEIIENRGQNNDLPLSIETMASPIGWSAPIDQSGNWMKNPIRPESASPLDYTIIDKNIKDTSVSEEEEYMQEWLEDE